MYFILAASAVALTLIVGLAASARREFQEWNGGVDVETGEPWVNFDCDSSGARGYKSSKRYIWISFPWVDASK